MKSTTALLLFAAGVLAFLVHVCSTVVVAVGPQGENQGSRSTAAMSQLLVEWHALRGQQASAEGFFRKLVREAFNEGSDAAYAMLWALRDSADTKSVAAAVNEAVLVFHERGWPRADRRKFSLWFMTWYEKLPQDATFDSGYLGRVLYVSQVDEVHRLLDMLDDKRLSVTAPCANPRLRPKADEAGKAGVFESMGGRGLSQGAVVAAVRCSCRPCKWAGTRM